MSDLTRSWLLYQGIVFVLVMMYMPNGLVGVTEHAVRLVRLRRGRFAGWPLVLTVTAAALLAAAPVFGVEMLQRLFAQDYQSQRSLSGGAWPALQVFGRAWNPVSIGTWAVPLLLVFGGVAAELLARRAASAAEVEVEP
jgi:branched-chain amino acid transport system permease protein